MSRKSGPEGSVKDEIMHYLKTRKIVCWVNSVGFVGGIRFGRPGLPDILGYLPDGRFLGIEVKRPKGGRVTGEQLEFIVALRRAGGLGVIATGVEEVMVAVEGATRRAT